MQAPNEKAQQSPGVIATLSAGFDLTTRHIWLIIIPFMLDVFYWLGPRLSIQSLVEQTALPLLEEPALAEMVNQVVEGASQINLFTSLSVPLIGIPALMNGLSPDHTPISPSMFVVGSVDRWLILLFGLSLLGLFLTVIYLGLIGRALSGRDESVSWHDGHFIWFMFKSVWRLIGLGIIFLFALIIISIPLLPLAFILSLVANILSVVVLVVGFAFTVTYLTMAVPGIIVRGHPLAKAVADSIRLAHRNILSTINLLALIFLISSGMNLLWHLADDGSWLTIVSIAGHAFISTALVAAVFIYYWDRSKHLLAELSG